MSHPSPHKLRILSTLDSTHSVQNCQIGQPSVFAIPVKLCCCKEFTNREGKVDFNIGREQLVKECPPTSLGIPFPREWTQYVHSLGTLAAGTHWEMPIKLDCLLNIPSAYNLSSTCSSTGVHYYPLGSHSKTSWGLKKKICGLKTMGKNTFKTPFPGYFLLHCS